MGKIEILYESKDWIVVNKPIGLSVHNNEGETNLLKRLEKQGLKEFSPVNRLDKDTSGIMVLSAKSEITAKLQAAFSADSASKSYLAIVKGVFKDGNKKGSWEQDLTNKAEGRANPLGIKKDRVHCRTSYEVLNMNKYLTLLLLRLETGRQHQIRKHCVHEKHQVIGDPRYGDKKFNSLIQKKYSFSDMALHSYKLKIRFENHDYKFTSLPPKSWAKLDLFKNEDF